MKEILSIKFVEYLRENNPDVLFSLQEEGSLINYINEKMSTVGALLQELQKEQTPHYIIEELCMNELTTDLRPSKYNYVKDLLEEEFIEVYHRLLGSGILRFEIINIISACEPLFEAFGFSEEKENDKHLRYTVIGTIKEYLEKSEKENRVSWPTIPIINS